MNMSTSTAKHVYESFVRCTPEQAWKAIIDGEQTQKYFFGGRVESNWKAGSAINYIDPSGNPTSSGTILEVEPQTHLKSTWVPGWLDGVQSSVVSWDVQSMGASTMVTLTHTDIDDATFDGAQMGVGWVFVLSSLKSLLETGEALPVPDIFG
jgi:uncharacterized protein YndB with AHSA1/START domain